MIRQMMGTAGVALLTAGLFSGVAVSEAVADSGPYLGAGVGAYTLKDDEIDFDDAAAFGRLFAGFALGDHWALELDYQRLAETEDDFIEGEVEVDADAFTVSLRPMVPLTDLIDLYGRVGWTWYDVQVDARSFGVPLSLDDSDDDFTWGGGVDLHLGDTLSLRGDFSRIEIKDTDLNLFSAGIYLRF